MEGKDDILQEDLCMACLCFGRSLRIIHDTKIKQYYLDTLNEIPLSNITLTRLVVCWECEAMLKKIVSFREQVQDSYRRLQTYTSENLAMPTDVNRAPRLKVINNDPIIIVPEKETTKAEGHLVYVKGEANNDSDDNEEQDALDTDYELSNEEDDSDSDSDSDIDDVVVEKKRKKTAPGKAKKAEPVVPSVNIKKEIQDCPQSNDESAIVKPKEHELNTEAADDDEIPLVQYIKQEITIDWEECDPQEPDDEEHPSKHIEVEVPAIPGEKMRDKNVVGGLKRKIKPQNSKAEQHYISVELTHDEMMLERQNDATKDSYIKAEHKCDTCLVGFNYSRAYEVHMKRRHDPNIGEYMCPICSTIIPSVDTFTSHYKRHMRRFECTVCQTRAFDRDRITQHLYTAHKIALATIQCKQCGYISHSMDSHIHHLDTHKDRLKCPECEKTFKNRGGLKGHVIAVHELNNNFPCPVCGKVFRWKNTLKKHEIKMHNLTA